MPHRSLLVLLVAATATLNVLSGAAQGQTPALRQARLQLPRRRYRPADQPQARVAVSGRYGILRTFG